MSRPVPAIRRRIGGVAYDSTTASVLHHWNLCESAEVQMGEAPPFDIGSVLMVNVFGAYFRVDYNELGDVDALTLTPLTVPQAIDWAERHCEWLVEEIFGQMPEAGQGTPYVAISP
jgi:hypothetical protein